MKKNISLLSLFIIILTSAYCGKTLKTDEIAGDTNTNLLNQTDEILPGNSITESGIKDISNHSGTFSISMSGYKGEMFIGIADNRFYGTLKFFNWGNGVPQPLNDLKVTEDKIYFKRIINKKEDLLKYGGTAYFEQDFYGIFTADKKTIKGYYRYTGTQDNWQAKKIK